ncbi:MAG TPA: iron-sulfur cluster assembly accessory protein [Blastocatellia bacterium]|nr:iron-sulfur cluster assembly accessory protein [Blastocatellia bacterium]
MKVLQLTEQAAARIREIMRDNGLTEGGLRVGVQGGGCSGLSYNLALDTEQRPGDRVFEHDGVKVFVDMKSLLYLNGATLDWKDEGLMQRGFTFINPNSSGDCGCGESFAV